MVLLPAGQTKKLVVIAIPVCLAPPTMLLLPLLPPLTESQTAKLLRPTPQLRHNGPFPSILPANDLHSQTAM